MKTRSGSGEHMLVGPSQTYCTSWTYMAPNVFLNKLSLMSIFVLPASLLIKTTWWKWNCAQNTTFMLILHGIFTFARYWSITGCKNRATFSVYTKRFLLQNTWDECCWIRSFFNAYLWTATDALRNCKLSQFQVARAPDSNESETDILSARTPPRHL